MKTIYFTLAIAWFILALVAALLDKPTFVFEFNIYGWIMVIMLKLQIIEEKTK